MDEPIATRSADGPPRDRASGPGRVNPEVERWFLRRGLPQFIADYNARDDVLTRMVPFLALLLVLQVFGALDRGWRWWENLLALLGASIIMTAGWIASNRLRGRDRWSLPDRVSAFEVVVLLVLVPFVAVLLVTGFDGSQAFLVVVANLLAFAVGYLFTSFGLLAILGWALRELGQHVGSVLSLMARTLPLTLVFATFLFLNAELWQVASDFTSLYFGLSIGLLVLVGSAFVLLRLPAEVDGLRNFASWAEVDALVAESPVLDDWSAPEHDASPKVRRLTRRHWLNVALVWLFIQSVQILLVSALIAGFYALFGLVTVRESTIVQWTTLDQTSFDPLITLGDGDGKIVVTLELIRVAVFLGAFSGLQFAVQTLIDEHHRREFLAPVIHDLRQALAVREVYLNELDAAVEPPA